MADTKHVGRIIKTKKKCGIVYRVVPGEPDNCVVVMTESLEAADHDSLINLINSSTAQDAYELGECMARAQLSDGRNMLAAFHTTGRMQKVATALVEVTPNNNASINLGELNNVIAQQKGVTVSDLALGGAKKAEGGVVNAADAYVAPAVTETAIAADDGIITDEKLAAKYRSDADRLSKEAAALRREADALVPKAATTKKAGKASVKSA